ncbi:MAG: zinc ribbon domain-containing protein [Armatimonadota bacterium]|nr:hypothetical protein [bacterium]
MNCRHCGAELHEDQKVCIVCGKRTERGDGFDYDIKGPWRPTMKMVVGASVFFIILILVLMLNSLRTVPPEIVAKQWFDAMSDRKLGTAERLATPHLEETLQAKVMDLRALSDEYYSDFVDSKATPQVSVPTFDNPQQPTAANINIRMTFPNGDPARDVVIELVKVGRQWRVNSVM